MLDDVASLLHLPIIGEFHTFQPLHVDEVVLMLVDLLLVSPEVARTETGHCHGPYVSISWLRDMYNVDVRLDIGQLQLVRIFFIFWVALFLLTRVQPMFMLCSWMLCVTLVSLGGIHGELLPWCLSTIT